jgi:DNA-binding transcriptional regulator YhcF (GntR family)
MNNKVDDYGNIYVFITRKEMGEYLKSSSKTVIKVFKELENANLIKIQIVSSVFGYKQYNDNYDKTGLLKFAFFRTNLCRFLYKHIKEINLRLQNEIDLSN